MTTPDQLEAVRGLVALGLSVIPLPPPGPASACKTPDKHGIKCDCGKRPTLPWSEFQSRLPTPAELYAWFGAEPRNLAIITGAVSGIVVVDADSAQAEEWLKANLPVTPWRVRTARGVHWYYRHPSQHVANRAHVALPGGGTIDLRGDGGYVVGPGSVHASGAVYAPEGNWDAPKAAVPLLPLEALPAPPARAYSEPVARSVDAPERVLERARLYVAACDPAVQGSGGDNQTFMVCARIVRGFDLSEDQALDVLRPWNARCVPPWDEAELLAKIRHALRYGDEPIGGRRDEPLPPSAPPLMMGGRALGTGPGGALHPDHPFAEREPAPEAVTAAVTEARASPPLAEPLADFMARVALMPEPRWLVPELIPGEGITLFHGQPRDGKSMAALECLLALTTATPAFSIDHMRSDTVRRVWYMTEEDPERQVYARLNCMFKGRGLRQAPEGFFMSVHRSISIDEPEAQAEILADVKQTGTELLVLDPLRSITANADQGPSELKPVTQFLRYLMRETGTALLIIHHDTKPKPGVEDTRRRPQRASGGGLFSIADAPVNFERADEDRSVLIPAGYKFSATPKAITTILKHDGDGTPRNPTTWMQLVGEQASEMNAVQVAKEAKIMEFLRAHPGAGLRAILAHMNARTVDIKPILDRLSDEGRVHCVKLGPGRRDEYKVVDGQEGEG